jgi:hypothetical protein
MFEYEYIQMGYLSHDINKAKIQFRCGLLKYNAVYFRSQLKRFRLIQSMLFPQIFSVEMDTNISLR